MEYDEWAAAVLTTLAVQKPAVTLESLRGDEPVDAHGADISPADYVTMLILEWSIYGPEGE